MTVNCYCPNSTNTSQFVTKEVKCTSTPEADEVRTEATVMSQVDHINIIKFYDLRAASPQHLTIVMEYANDG